MQRGILIILDGFGNNPSPEVYGNAIKMAKTPQWDLLTQNYPTSQLKTSGEAVGLPEGQMGNSEIGHLNIGSGRIIYSDLERVSIALRKRELYTIPEFEKFLDQAVSKRIHLFILLSDGGVHSDIYHLLEFLKLTSDDKLKSYQFYIHAFLDGRDTPPKSGIHFVKQVLDKIATLGNVFLASCIGRYYAMDRDNRWERIEKAYKMLSGNENPVPLAEALQIIQQYYDQNITDEFMEPIFLHPDGAIRNGDSIFFMNFRADRARQITRVFTDKNFLEFNRISNEPLNFLCLTEYKKEFQLPVLFKPVSYKNLLGEVLSRHKIKQARIAETEKYAHVTFFFNGGLEQPYDGELRFLVNSPKVATYDLQPQMSAKEVKEKVLENINDSSVGLIVVNFANGDMVGHTGVLNAAIQAVETLDDCLKEIIPQVLAQDMFAIITADHGNCEQMFATDGSPFTQHTIFPVPVVLVGNAFYQKKNLLAEGALADLAPTILHLMGLEIPRGAEGMTGKVLIKE